jgi:hypothetical protein
MRLGIATGILGVGGFLFLWYGLGNTRPEQSPVGLTAAPSPNLTQALSTTRRPFAEAAVDCIQSRGYLSVTIHVALADHRIDGLATRFSDGNRPATNLYWGALFGVETHLIHAAGWRRAYTDDGDGVSILRRVVFQRRVQPTAAWRRRGADREFDLFVLANAWPADHIIAAMERPLHEALGDSTTVFQVGGQPVEFGSGSVVIGYVGSNGLLEKYRDLFADLEPSVNPKQVGVFYLAPRSAVSLYAAIVQHGLYPVLLAREPIVPEAYVVDGILQALTQGDLDEGFLTAAAEQYARFQKGVSFERARAMFYR